MKIKAFAALVKQTKILKIYNVLDAEGAVYPMMIKYLKPLSKADDRPMFFYRSGMIAIKSGLLLQGLVYAGSLAHQNAMTDCLIQLGSTIRRSQLIQNGNATEQSLEGYGFFSHY